ncbi:ppa [Wigglesworthia glossinidia endosymbiont of Glossina brevipalpis]|uniref:Inorganic pyrophosphatase n=1 Tax=Wigglesworthia glossinidia brevipalpis TaxID=36870 RepID=IPYR_WIGBR|nr:RecName: Full=Inorganic pyrophosphatase; AltName: Full=Pyrophosphate phospho-hydrolase; Short=PPase [Wigglesworthia glossinidia endosymbiont of Glossina brevipalpis]BAC24626.1 ppa [Wigglesworthia glossinidia endosymbiont of Glossina brevipalpis]
MNLNSVPAGEKLPNDIYAIIEIPTNSNPIKYEVDKKTGILFVNRFIPTSMFYPCNYGYINHTISLDGDPLDILVPTPYPVLHGSVIRCNPIGVLKMIDESGEDAKIIAMPHQKLLAGYNNNIKNIDDISNLMKSQISHFFEHYKDLEKKKWTKVISWEDVKSAEKEILSSFNRKKTLNI